MKWFLGFILALSFIAHTQPVHAQPVGLLVGQTPVIGGNSDQCLTITLGVLTSGDCLVGVITTFSGGSTGFTPNTPTTGGVVLGGVLTGANGGSGVANTGTTFTRAGNVAFAGAFGFTGTLTGTTGVTFPTSGTLLANGSIIPLTVGNSTLAGGTDTRILYDNAGSLGEYTLSGTGTVVAMQTAPSFLGSVTLPSVAWASIPSATAGKIVRVSDAGSKGSTWMADGTRWKPMNGEVVLATLDTPSSQISNSETIVFQYLIPAGMWQVNDVLRFYLAVRKSGNTDSTTLRIKIGTAGTTSDPNFNGNTVLTAAQNAGGYIYDIKQVTTTSGQLLSRSDLGYGGATTAATPAAVTISDTSANNLYISVSLVSSGASNTSSLYRGELRLVSSAN